MFCFYSLHAFESVSPFSLFSQCGHHHVPGGMAPDFGMIDFEDSFLEVKGKRGHSGWAEDSDAPCQGFQVRERL